LPFSNRIPAPTRALATYGA